MVKLTLKYLIFAPCRAARDCESHAAQHPVHTPRPETHAATTLQYL